MKLFALPVDTRQGVFIARYSEKGLAQLDFPQKSRASVQAIQMASEDVCHWHDLTVAALKAVLAGKSPGIFPPLDLQGTEFQKQVWAVLLTIKPRQTMS